MATNERQIGTDLNQILQNGQNNGVHDLKMLSKHDVQYLEPEVQCVGGIFSPSTGILDSHEYMISLLGDAEEYGSTLVLNCNVENVSRIHHGGNNKNRGGEGGFCITTDDGSTIECDFLVNCAGLFSHNIASCIVSSDEESRSSRSSSVTNISKTKNKSFTVTKRRQYFAKGNYFQLVGQPVPFQHLIYPVPEPGGLGIHATLDCAGQCRFGPDVEWISMDDDSSSSLCPDSINMDVDPNRANVFYNAIQKYWPGLNKNCDDGSSSLAPDYAGLRPKIGHPDWIDGLSIKADFVLEGPHQHGIDGFINMMGMESPGLTSSLAVAEKVVSMMQR